MNIRASIAFSFTSKYVVFLLHFVSTIFLSRILTPSDIGIYSVAAAIISIGHMLRDFGVGNYIIQEKDLTTDKIRSAMGLTIFSSWLVSATLYYGADIAMSFYHEEGIKNVFQVLALNFLIIPFGSVTRTYIRRQLRFKFLMIMEIAGCILSSVVAIWLAYLNYRYMCMAWSSVAGIIFEILILQVFRPKELPYLPGIREIKKVFKFGSMSFLEALFNQLSSSLPDLIIGKILNMSAVGIFSRAQGVTSIFDRLVSQGIHPVMLPYFSKENRDGVDIKSSYLYATHCTVGLAWPAFSFISIMATPLISVLYGYQWMAVVVPLQFICLGNAITQLTAFASLALISKGYINQLAKLQALLITFQLFIMLFTVDYGLVYMVSVIAIGFSSLRALLILRILNRVLSITLSDYGLLILKCLYPTITTSFAVGLLKYNFEFNNITMLIISSIVFGFVFLVSIFIFDHPLKIEINKMFAHFSINKFF